MHTLAPERAAGQVELLLDRLSHPRRVGPDRFTAHCPAHEDNNRSLSIREGRERRVLVHCFAGCTAAEIVRAVGLRLSDLFLAPRASSQPPRAETTREMLERGMFDLLRAQRWPNAEDLYLAAEAVKYADRLRGRERPADDFQDGPMWGRLTNLADRSTAAENLWCGALS